MFYDLNLAVDGVGEQSRREMVAMAMQLGYSGVAFNHVFSGIMADSDRCKLRPLELRTVLAAAPGVAEAAKFHRGILGVPPRLPFRQFTRITVVVDNPAQANALNSGNPVLKTYDLVAVRPTNQKSFNQACSHLEVDLIAVDASQRLPFRFKMPMLKAAIERGIYFEISYGRTIFDPRARRELFANAQMLQSAARGRNIIVTSGAQRAMELRGPNDAANMSTLFGLTLESAKAAVSRNCKSVLMHGVMRKATHRGAIHIGHALAADTTVDPDNLFDVPTNWDPLSLGGASADFIPMDETLEQLLKKNSPPSSTVGVSEKLFGSTAWASSVNTGVDSTKFNTKAKYESVREVSLLGVQQAEKGVQDKSKGASKATVNHEQTVLAGTVRGLLFSSSVRESTEVSVSATKENTQHFPVSPLGKQAMRDHKKVEPTVHEGGLKKGKQVMRDNKKEAPTVQEAGLKKAKKRKRKR